MGIVTLTPTAERHLAALSERLSCSHTEALELVLAWSVVEMGAVRARGVRSAPLPPR